MNVNLVVFAGNLTRDPELRSSKDGLAIVKFGVACNEYGGKDEQKRTTFADVVAFGKRGEAIHKHLRKGDPIFVRGRLSFSSWEAQGGGRRSKLEIVVDDFQFCGSKADKGTEREPGGGTERVDLPF